MASNPSYGWYGDDFTGATDTLASLAERDIRALLFLHIPTAEQLIAAGPLDAIGIAGATRAMAPEPMATELDAAGRFFAEAGVGILHYKCCSTFDSAPHVGSIGAAVRALRPHFANPFLPIIGGQPNLGRYCLFGTLFAAAGSGGPVHRIDRHPTMSVHPVTPMAEADLRRHLAAQGLERIALVDYRSYEATDAEAKLATALASAPDAILLDVARSDDLAIIGRLLRRQMDNGPMLAIGPSSVAQALAASWPGQRRGQVVSDASSRRTGPVLALVGSLSPVTRAQVEASTAYERIGIDTASLLSEPAYSLALEQEAHASLSARRHVMLVTNRPSQAPGNMETVALATARLLGSIMTKATIGRLVVAGGDTSSLAVKSLDIWGLSYRAALVPGAPLCRTHSDDPRLDGLDIVLKGGQMGPVGFFDAVAAS
ncbi:four-carbon acid sugar kinase family protein [Bosea vaviloviae]|uniref:Lipoprotein n=1 Tax=Bosea vaviloviae TaxID=1526658 RepID=A0A0N1F6D3_9HYPH|nr:four-carbon acid sugar kinase family protein [Bosea vaviloviae]KPH81494.1 lipoprotein [Bosea vaviloviae]